MAETITTTTSTANTAAPPKQHPAPKVTTSTGAAYIDRHTALLAPVFATDPAFMFMLSGLAPDARAAYQPKYMHVLLRASMLNEGVFVEADDWSCAAVWMPPGKRPDNELTIFQAGFLGVLWTVGMVGVKKMLVDFAGQSNKIKKQHLVDPQTGKSLSRYHYLWFIGTDVAARGRGLASHLIRLRQKVAKEDGLPMWLEATTAKSRDVYAKCGFRVMGEIQLGVGTHATTGFAEKGGSGLVVYAMMWRSEWEIEGQEGTTVKTDP